MAIPLLDDPKGSIDRPYSVGGTKRCDKAGHNSATPSPSSVELFEVRNMASPPVPLTDNDPTCLQSKPALGWQWTTSAPTGVTLVSVPPIPTPPNTLILVPPINPDGVGPNAPSSGTTPHPDGHYGWNAPTGRCYVVKFTSAGGCMYYSPIIPEKVGAAITDLDLHVDTGSPPSCPTPNATCP